MTSTPEIFEQSFLVEKRHLDEQNHVNNVQYVQWVQDIAKAHWEARANQKQNLQYFWVVIKHEINYKKQAFLGNEILIQTYVSETSHVKSIRHVIIKNAETKKVLVEAKTTWALMDQEKKRPTKISEELKRIFQQ
ncbi:acyl-CoA thioesterase [Salegentibacter maritimus]|uniref:Acyl-CoA thioesterase n=1 Tax=Salegentibacter maritimus TaxID=2794347 RepID=A0ABS0TFV5_9FLAO|nr:acyl-CoA thioesterase [Salegentibacter maritimus]MBI6118074.1 acyl-CoA thioesterase [Salegentibacter maritimus]MBI6119903.1 acyl-CoA thioesterase [Salegentibacter maritimus]